MRFTFLTAALAALLLVAAAPAAALDNLNPNSTEANLDEVVPVNVVFVGYDFSPAQKAAFMAQLPSPGTAAEPAYRVIERYPNFYDISRLLGLDYRYEYNVVDAPDAFENALWAKLSELATPEAGIDGQDITLFQQQYNDQAKNVLDVANNHFIDAPTVERWLADNASFVDTTRNTVFFVNWWGMGAEPRAGFKFHTYVKTGEPDPDTGYDFGANRQSRKIIAWGGTPMAGANGDEETGLPSTRRIWFHDLSAGPESWTENWFVDGGDADGDGTTNDYVIPAVWEYLRAGGLGPREGRNLAADLGKVTRYVAINLLFTPSPLYSPNLTFPRQPRTIDLDVNTFEGWNGVDASTLFQDLPYLLDEEKELVPTIVSAENQDIPFRGDSLRCYQQFVSNHLCYSNRAPYGPFGGGANLFLWAAQNRPLWSDGDAEYEAPAFNWAVNQAPKAAGPLGFADDNWLDGTQSGVFNFIDPTIVSLGYGLTTTEIHEYGHHFAMSHPHDGFDWQTQTDYGPEGETLYTWAGDETNSVMSYIDLNWDFSQFDRDNMHRYQAAAYWRSSNEIARLAAAKALDLGNAPATADALLGYARQFVAQHNYPGGHVAAWYAYEVLRQAYEATGNTLPASQRGWELLPPQKKGKGHAKVPRYVVDHHVGRGTHRGQP